jgi:hypothetical protein
MSQTEAIKSALEAGDKLTPIDALNRFGVFRLGARVHELRREGLDVKSRLVATPSGKHVAEYSL